MNKKFEFGVYVLATVAVFAAMMIIASSFYGESVSNLLLIGFAGFISPIVAIPATGAFLKWRFDRDG